MNLLENVIKADYLELKKKKLFNAKGSSETNERIFNYPYIFSVNNDNLRKELIATIKEIYKDKNISKEEFTDVINIKEEIYTIKNISLKEAINIFIDISENRSLYGVVIKLKDKIDEKRYTYNMAHPNTPDILRKYISRHEKELDISIHIYEYKDNYEEHYINDEEIIDSKVFNIVTSLSLISNEEINKKNETYIMEYTTTGQLYTVEISNIGNINSKIVHLKKNISTLKLLENMKRFSSNTESIRIKTSYKMKNYIYIPVQIINNNIIYPYYGGVLLKQINNDIGGISLSPFLSPNVVFKDSEGYQSICTGAENNKSEEGWSTLIDANLGSPFTKRVITKGYEYILPRASILFTREKYKETIGEMK